MEHSDTIPIQYREGMALFMGMGIKVDPRVLIPRPETELLVSVACGMLRPKEKNSPRVLDLCTGSGAVALGILKLVPGADITAADVSREALDLAAENLGKFAVNGRISLAVSDMFSAFGGGYGSFFDCIVSNPPYVSDKDYESLDPWVKAEPSLALRGGERGMDYLEIIAAESLSRLKSGGFVAVEIGYDQSVAVKESFNAAGFKDIRGYRDMSGYERVITGRKDG
jgi:release factor glutamine methyltransferase